MNEKYVLLVEDNPDDVSLTQIAFKRNKVPNQLEVVSDGEEALDFLFGRGKYAERDTSQLPAVILLDIKLPQISGVEVLKQIRLNFNTRRVPVVVLSSLLNLQELDECERMGINRYWRKPTNSEDFKKIITEIQRTWL